jgi:hypothetical protein
VTTPNEGTAVAFEGSGADVRRLREHYRLSRRLLAERCGYPSQTRIFNIETKDSWKTGDRERLGAAFAALADTTPPMRGAEAAEHLMSQLEANGQALWQIEQQTGVATEPADYGPEIYSVPEDLEPLTPTEMVAVGPASEVPAEAENAAEPVTEAAPVATPEAPPNGEGANGVITDEHLASITGLGLSEAAVQTSLEGFRPLTNSEVSAWLRCRRKWWAFWYRGLVYNAADPGGARATGSRVHKALAAWYVPEGEDAVDPREALERIIAEDWARIEEDARNFDATGDVDAVLAGQAERFSEAVGLERAMVEGYVQWLEEVAADSHMEMIGSEQVVTAVIEGEVAGEYVRVQLLGRLDGRAHRTSDGARLFMDHKTVGNFTEPQKTLHMDPQMLHYMLLEALTGTEGQPFCNTALYNMLRKVKRTANARPPFYLRVEIHHSPIEVESYRRKLLGITRDVRRATSELEAGADPLTIVYPTVNKTCSWDCDFFPVCPMLDDGSRAEDAISALFHVEDPLQRYGDEPID